MGMGYGPIAPIQCINRWIMGNLHKKSTQMTVIVIVDPLPWVIHLPKHNAMAMQYIHVHMYAHFKFK